MTIRYLYILIFLGLITSCDEQEPVLETYAPDFGPPETLITVQGANFGSIHTLNFNDDVPADFNPSYGSDNALLFRVPKNAPLGDNTIRIGTDGGEITLPFRVTLEAPQVLDFFPSSAPEGGEVIIVGENFFEPLVVLFQDSVEAEFAYKGVDSLVVIVPEGASKGFIKVKANGGVPIWIGGTEHASFNQDEFDVYEIDSDLNNTFLEFDGHNNGKDITKLTLILRERNGSLNDFTATIDIEEDSWTTYSLPLNRFKDIDGLTINPQDIKVVKLHIVNPENETDDMELNIDNLKFVEVL